MCQSVDTLGRVIDALDENRSFSTRSLTASVGVHYVDHFFSFVRSAKIGCKDKDIYLEEEQNGPSLSETTQLYLFLLQ